MSESKTTPDSVLSSERILTLQSLTKSYHLGLPTQTQVLHGIDMSLDRHEFVSLTGPSGSGKSTLLNILGLLDQPTTGELYLLGQPTRTRSDQERTSLRRHHIGFVFQFHHLIEAFSALENVLMPLMIDQGRPDAPMQEWGRHLLESVGLVEMSHKKPSELSGGQQQRVAIARALATRPDLLLADEPTGNLDTQTAGKIFEMLRQFNQEFGCAVLIVTHDPKLAQDCDRTLNLVDGRLT